MKLGVLTAAVTTMTSIFNGEHPDAAFRAAQRQLVPDTPESIALERQALGGMALDPVTDEIAPGQEYVPREERVIAASPENLVGVSGPAAVTADAIIEEASIAVEGEAEIIEGLTTQLQSIATAMNSFHEDGLGPSGQPIQVALAAGDIELAAQIAYQSFDEAIEALPADMEGRQNMIDMATSHQQAIVQSSTALGFEIQTNSPEATSFAAQVEEHQSSGVGPNPAILPSGERLSAYQTILNSVGDVTIPLSAFGGENADIALSTGGDIEIALEADDTEAAARIAYNNLEILKADPNADVRTMEALQVDIRSGAEALGFTVDQPSEIPAQEMAMADDGFQTPGFGSAQN